MTRRKPVNYLNNKDILKEIHKSKSSYSYYIDKKYDLFDAIVDNLSDINDEVITLAKEKRLKRIIDNDKEEQLKNGTIKKNIVPLNMTVDDIPEEDLVFRVMTYEHIPLQEGRVKTPKKDADYRVRLSFKPFKHYIIKDGDFCEVGRSHWKDGLHNGVFCQDHGKITDKLGMMYMELANRFARKGNYRSYSYKEDMVDRAIEQLVFAGLSFDESKTDNPFAYFTVCCTTSFTSILNIEKKNQNLRDNLIEAYGGSPSFTRQVENEFNQQMESYYEDRGLEQPKPLNVPKVGFKKKPAVKND